MKGRKALIHAPEPMPPLLHFAAVDNFLKAEIGIEHNIDKEEHYLCAQKILKLAAAGKPVEQQNVIDYVDKKLARFLELVRKRILDKWEQLLKGVTEEKAAQWVEKNGGMALSAYVADKQPTEKFEVWKQGTDLCIATAVKGCSPKTAEQKAKQVADDALLKAETEKAKLVKQLADAEAKASDERSRRQAAEELATEKKRRLDATEMRMSKMAKSDRLQQLERRPHEKAHAAAASKTAEAVPLGKERFLCSVFVCEAERGTGKCNHQQIRMGGRVGSADLPPGPRSCPVCYLTAVENELPEPEIQFLEIPAQWSLAQFHKEKVAAKSSIRGNKTASAETCTPEKPLRTAAKSSPGTRSWLPISSSVQT